MYLTFMLLIAFTSCNTSKTATAPPPPPPPMVIAPMPPPVDLEHQIDYNGTYPKVEAGKYDNGKMWTFSYPPKKYFSQTYGFEPSDEWLETVRQSALRFATYCTASFVSEDGLVMTNHHCGRQSVTEVTREGEDLPKDGFYAKTLADERPVPGLFVDQLVSMQDITNQVMEAMNKGTSAEEKAKLREETTSALIKSHSDEKDMTYQVHNFYNGSVFQLFGYKRYNDVRLVIAPETALGFFGGDPDNFTYPRYCLDYTFFRVYDEAGKPLKTKYYYKWSPDGPKGNEPIFVVGNPGTTKRLATVSQLEYDRDYSMPMTIDYLKTAVSTYKNYLDNHPESKLELTDTYFSMSNSLKAYEGMYGGLKDPILMGKRADFERTFKAKVFANNDLKRKYGHLWDDIHTSRKQISMYFDKQVNFSPANFGSEYFGAASQAIRIAEEMKKPMDARNPRMKSDEDIQKQIAELAPNKGFHREIEQKMIEMLLRRAYTAGMTYLPGVKDMKSVKDAESVSRKLMSNTVLDNEVEVKALFAKGPEAVLTSNDPFISYARIAGDSLNYYRSLIIPISQQETQNVQALGQALYSVYGTEIPPDANFTLRIADGVVKDFDYNGTVAPENTTFYGLYDRFYSYGQKDPWDLPEKWQNPPATFDKSTQMNFVSTNDIIGGNSGSALINANKEVVGLAFDGNIQSLPSRYIYDVDSGNRCVSVHSSAILESIRQIYKADRIADELVTSKLQVPPAKTVPAKIMKKKK